MLNALIRLALRYRAIVVLLCLIVLTYGSYLTSTIPIDVLPNLDRPRVVVLTEAENLAAEQVETLVSFPIEASLLGASGVQTVRSESTFGLSLVYAEFDWGANLRDARQTVQERLMTVQSRMPRGVRPVLAPTNSIMGRIMLVGMHYQRGPHGGELAAIGKTGHVAELICNDAKQVSLWLFNPRGSQHERLTDPNDWQPIKISQNTYDLKWQPSEPGKSSSLAKWNVVKLDASANGGLSGQIDYRPGADPDWETTERRVTVVVEGKPQEIVFLPIARRLMDLRTMADWTVQPQLKIPGISQVTVTGGGRKQYQVLVEPEALVRYDVSLRNIEDALEKSNLNASGGVAIIGEQEQAVQIVGRLGPDAAEVIKELEKIVVKPATPRPILLGEVARVVERPQLKRGDASVNGHPGVVMAINKQLSADTRQVTSAINEVLQKVQESLPPEVVLNNELFQMKNFIDRAVFNVAEALVIGALLVLLILFLFLLNFRTTFISLVAIPLSLVLTGMVFKLFDWFTNANLTINIMTLGGIAVAMGELVDDAIVDVENIFRRLRENSHLPHPRSSLRVIYEASVEVRSAIVFGTIVVVLVFLPLFMMPGMPGRLFPPLAVAYIVSILASLLVSLTVTPVLSYYLLPQAKAAHREGDGALLRGLKWAAGHLVRLSMAWPVSILLFSWCLFLISILTLILLDKKLLPDFNEGSVQIDIGLPPGSSLEASNRACGFADAVLSTMRKSSDNPDGEILNFERRTGRAELDEEVEPVCNSEYIITLNPACALSREQILDKIQKSLGESVNDGTIDPDQPLKHLINHVIGGSKGQIQIKVFGDDLNVLRALGEQVKKAAARVEGLKPAVLEAIEQMDEIHLRKRPAKLAEHGMDWASVADFLSTALKGKEVTEVLDGQRRFDVVLKLDDATRADFSRLAKMRLELPNQRGTIPVEEVVRFPDSGDGDSGANEIKRENTRRRLVVRCAAEGRNQSNAVAELKERIRSDIRLPAGYSIEYAGEFQAQSESMQKIIGFGALSFVSIFFVLYFLFPSARIVLQILNAIPMAVIGGAAALVITRQEVSIASAVGFISLGGIAVRNGILLVSHYFHLMRHEGESFTKAMILRGSLERLSPVLMTALTAGIGLVPLVVGGHQPGREILYPVATVILGGLVTSTLCEFLIHPGLFWRFSGKDAYRLAHHKIEKEDALSA